MPQGERLTSWVRVFTVLTLIIGAAAMIPAQSVINLVARPAQHAADFAASSWQEYLKVDAAPPQELPSTPAPSKETAETVKGPSEAEVQKMAQPEILVPLAGPDRPAAIEETSPNRLTRAPDSPAAETRRAPTGKAVKTAPDIRNHRNTGRQAPTAVKENLPPSRDLETEIAKAIASRAILGVEVSVVRGTAILDGHVATERQRRAAERAALSVSGVERVRNRIAITFG
jgi:hypothetical protein